MSDYILGEIRLFAGNFAPPDWAKCDGSIIPISSNQTLFSLISNLYGGDAITTFALPDMKGRIPVHRGTGPGLTARPIASKFGAESVTLTAGQMPSHVHPMQSVNSPASTNDPTNNMTGIQSNPIYDVYAGSSVIQAMNAASVLPFGGNAPHDNMMPSLAITFMICVQNGVYPARN